MNEQSTPSEDRVKGPGEILKQARIAKNLSIEAVAESLRLSTEILINIEADNFDGTISTTFIRGYLRNYSKILHIDSEKVVLAYNNFVPVNEQSPAISPTFETSLGKQFEKSSRISILQILIFIAFAIAAGVGLGYLYMHQSEIFNTTTADFSNEIKLSTSIPEDPTINIHEMAINSKLSVSESNLSDQKIVGGTQHQQQKIAVETVTEEPLKFDEGDTASVDILSLDFFGDCWVKITDATGEVLAIGIKRNEKSMSLKGIAPFEIILGNPAVVSLSFNQKLVDLSSYRQGRKATITIPKEVP